METCPKCNRPLRNPKGWHYCKEVSIDSLFEGKKEELILIFDKILVELVRWENTEVSATKNCIVFLRNKTFLIIKPMKTQLDLKFYLDSPNNNYPICKSVLWNNKYETHIRLKSIDELDATVFKYLKGSYKIS